MSDAATVKREPLGGVDVASSGATRRSRSSFLDRWLPRGVAHQVIAVRETPARVFLRSVTFVVLYWWLATGAIVGSPGTELEFAL